MLAKANKTVTLFLDTKEASMLLHICQRISGRPKYTRRGLTDNISCALFAAGVVISTNNYSGSLEFTED